MRECCVRARWSHRTLILAQPRRNDSGAVGCMDNGAPLAIDRLIRKEPIMATTRNILCVAFAGAACTFTACTDAATATSLQAGAKEAKNSNESIEFEQTKIIIEHNATALDTGFQGFVDGEPWSTLTVSGPDGKPAVEVKGLNELKDTGLTELFFETDEPPNAEVPIEEMLARLPEGTYDFRAKLPDGGEEVGSTTLSHAIPNGPEILSPRDGSEICTDEDVQFRWSPVTTSIRGEPITVTHYEVIMEVADQTLGAGFGKENFDVHVRATTTALRVPREFLRPGTDYLYEVLAIAENGNQTLSSGELSTK